MKNAVVMLLLFTVNNTVHSAGKLYNKSYPVIKDGVKKEIPLKEMLGGMHAIKGDDKKYHCSECGFSVVQAKGVNSHIIKEHAGYTFYCEYCMNPYETLRSYLNHRVKCKVRAFVKEFASKTTLVFDYVCPICWQTFDTPEALRAHDHTAFDESLTVECKADKIQEFICGVCGNGFKLQRERDRHQDLCRIVGRSN